MRHPEHALPYYAEQGGECALFEQAYAIDPNPNYLFNIGRVYEEKGDIRSAVDHYQRFVKEPGVDIGSRELAVQRLRVLKAILNETEAPAATPSPLKPVASVIDLMAGQVDVMFDGLGSSAAHIRSGRLRALAVAATQRAPGFPDIPTSTEGGVPTYQVATWYGLWAPKGTPKEIVEAMQAAMRKALNTDELKNTWNGLGAETPNLWGADFGKFVSSEVKRWAEVVKAGNVKPD